MKIFKNKVLTKLIASICLFLALLNFLGSSKVYAAEGEVWGGTLIKPIVNLLTGVGDAVMELLHKSVQEQDAAIIRLQGTSDFWETLGGIIAIVAGIIVAVLVIVVVAAVIPAIAAAAITALGGTAAFTVSLSMGTLAAGALAGVCVGVSVKEALIPNDIYLPAFSITAEEIFANRIHLFDVNFFNPMDDNSTSATPEEGEIRVTDQDSTDYGTYAKLIDELLGSHNSYDQDNQEEVYSQLSLSDLYNTGGFQINNDARAWIYLEEGCREKIEELIDNIFVYIGESGISTSTFSLRRTYFEYDGGEFFDVEGKMIIHLASGHETTINFVMRNSTGIRITSTDMPTTTTTVQSTAKVLSGIISTWYFILRNFALIVLMLILVYTGIRIVIGSTAGEKAKYKERVVDWLVAICLVMIMHYIMVFAVTLVEEITKLISTTTNGNAVYLQLTDTQAGHAERDLADFREKFKEKTGNEENDIFIDEAEDGLGEDDSDGQTIDAITWPTDLAGLFRIQSQLEDEGTANWVGYSICYLVLVLYTLFFAYTYVRRVIYMAFLTMIAPLVAMTYPIDKMTDGKAQAFNTWLKEYIFNLMIQPMHLLLYTILVTSAFQLASLSPIYALVAVGFMTPAEKLVRRFFGFEKAKTPGLLGGAAGAAMTMAGLQKLLSPKNKNRDSDKDSEGKDKDKGKIKYSNKNTINEKDGISGKKPNESKDKNNKEDGSIKMQNPSEENAKNTSLGDKNSSQEDEVLKKYSEEGYGKNAFGEYYNPWTDEYDANYDPHTDKNYQNEQAENQETDKVHLTENKSSENEKDDDTEKEQPEDKLHLTEKNEEDEDSEQAEENAKSDNEDVDNVENGENGEEHTDGADSTIANPGENQPKATNNSDSNVGQTEKPKRHFWKAVGRATLGVGKDVGKQAAIGVLKGVHPLRLAGKIALGATGATAGLVLGVASGDPSQAMKNTIAGGVAGSALARSMQGGKNLTSNNLAEEVKMEYYGEEYAEYNKKKILEKQKKELQSSQANINYLRQTMNVDKEQAKKILETTGSRCFDNGITDIKDIATIHKLTTPKYKEENGQKVEEKPDMSFEKAVAARAYAKKRLGGADIAQMSEDKIQKYQKRWANEFKERYGDLNDEQSLKLAKEALESAKKYNSAESSLTKL